MAVLCMNGFWKKPVQARQTTWECGVGNSLDCIYDGKHNVRLVSGGICMQGEANGKGKTFGITLVGLWSLPVMESIMKP